MARFDPARAAELIKAARADAGLTQRALAERVGLAQPSLAQMETGRRTPSAELLERVLEAADYRPSLPLAAHAKEIVAFAASRHLADVRVFGSTVRGEDHFDSDVDLLVRVEPGGDFFDIAALIAEAERLIGFPVDVVSETTRSPIADRIRAEAVPL
ncbi:helix-turn-helix domain-containing protein [Agromyces neolithicus]|uniref:HTH cro/C1-type domain-containing protein n=1 Tax=Agromyces neolithicus TaxID=269420 RepID=A0ABP4YDA6_9MICO